MNITIHRQPRSFHLYGFSGVAHDGHYGKTGKELMDRLWTIVRERQLKHKGINHWVYEPGDHMFTGVELEQAPEDTGLESKHFTLPAYAYGKHIGPYHLLKDAYAAIRKELADRGLTPGHPSLEIYGHWNSDESKLETEILISVGS
jgi:effector-binding domain-containing protein